MKMSKFFLSMFVLLSVFFFIVGCATVEEQSVPVEPETEAEEVVVDEESQEVEAEAVEEQPAEDESTPSTDKAVDTEETPKSPLSSWQAVGVTVSQGVKPLEIPQELLQKAVFVHVYDGYVEVEVQDVGILVKAEYELMEDGLVKLVPKEFPVTPDEITELYLLAREEFGPLPSEYLVRVDMIDGMALLTAQAYDYFLSSLFFPLD